MPSTFVIVGPTAVGKTDISLALAQLLENEHGLAEIVNADSMQLYRGMDIGTAKLPVSQRRGIVHHMLDVLDVTATATVSDYQSQARDTIAAIHGRGRHAVVVGGSGLFVNALLDDMQFPASDEQVRTRLEMEARSVGSQVLYDRLFQADPHAAKNLVPTNTRRVIRALEVLEITGSAPSTSLGDLAEVIPAIRIGLRRERHEIDSRIEARVENMWTLGFVDEVERLLDLGLSRGVTASQALGYKQLIAAHEGRSSLAEAKQLTVAGTRRYVRRQDSWFKRDRKITWFDAATVKPADLLALAPRIDPS
ncbi:MAG: tRNA (adenosine(37)-N6)-dimethylallyltransferase MiaA [Actinomycetes bacterium]